MSDERVRTLLREIERELAGTGATVLDAARAYQAERLRADGAPPKGSRRRTAARIRGLRERLEHASTELANVRAAWQESGHGEPSRGPAVTFQVVSATVRPLITAAGGGRNVSTNDPPAHFYNMPGESLED